MTKSEYNLRIRKANDFVGYTVCRLDDSDVGNSLFYFKTLDSLEERGYVISSPRYKFFGAGFAPAGILKSGSYIDFESDICKEFELSVSDIIISEKKVFYVDGVPFDERDRAFKLVELERIPTKQKQPSYVHLYRRKRGGYFCD